MRSLQRPAHLNWMFLLILIVLSILTTGCEKGSLGVKNGAITGVVLDMATNKPIADVLVSAKTTTQGGEIFRNCLSKGDGTFVLADLIAGSGNYQWQIRWEKFGWVASGSPITITVSNGATVQAPILWMKKTAEAVKGTLKGYPVDSITGSPLSNFTVSQLEPSRYKVFEMAEDFKTAGWQGLEGGSRTYTITCENYEAYTATATISNTPWDLGVIKLKPVSVSIHGTLRNLPGYILGGTGGILQNAVFWVEAAGKVVATGSAQAISGTAVYTITGIPVTAGSVQVKCKIRGYDVVVINPSLSIPKQRPGGVIGGVDADFANIEPIRRDVRVIIRGTAPGTSTSSTIEPGEVIRVYIQQGGKDIVPYVDCVGNNYIAEAYFTGVITGYPLDFLAVNQNRGFIMGTKNNVTIGEDGNTVYTIDMTLSGGS